MFDFIIFELTHFVMRYGINLGLLPYIFDCLAIFPRKSYHGEDDWCILNFQSLAVVKTQITRELLIFVY